MAKTQKARKWKTIANPNMPEFVFIVWDMPPEPHLDEKGFARLDADGKILWQLPYPILQQHVPKELGEAVIKAWNDNIIELEDSRLPPNFIDEEVEDFKTHKLGKYTHICHECEIHETEPGFDDPCRG